MSINYLLPKGKLRTAVKNNTDGGFVVRTNNKNINVINAHVSLGSQVQ